MNFQLMSDPEKVRTIAESCPFVFVESGEYVWKKTSVDGPVKFEPLTDSNAMREALKCLTNEQRKQYLNWLDIAAGGELPLSDMADDVENFIFLLLTADPSRQAEAFYLTIRPPLCPTE